ncbi:hypothetical protein BGZ95_001801 [Linnemannia exigua]|uniref:Myb-like domain-containing protein n=1 Tax=Linnemannia exigua TaxID=604196 RepID=A0AAD4D6D0_9FUNG|nr:hypothetical protein BGZ95_001801 [Linnemannia exigua]
MADAAQVTPILSSQEYHHHQQQQQRAPSQDHVHLQQQATTATLDTFNHQAAYPVQEQQQQQQQQQQQHSGHQEVAFRHHHHDPLQQQAHDSQLVEDITRAFLLQEMTSDPTGVRQGSQSMLLQQHAPSSVLPTEADDELNIYDYIYAKQEEEEEDDDEPEDHVVVSASSLSPSPAAIAAVASAASIQDLSHFSPAFSPSSSSVTATATSTPPPSSSSCVSQYDHATANTLSKDTSTSTLDTNSMKTKQDNLDSNVLFGPVNYMDTTMEIYEPSQVVSLPNQELYRLLLDELEVTTQREKYFAAATTTPNSTMGSVTSFLFNGQQTQTQTPTNPSMQMMGETAASPSVFSTKPEPLLAIKSEYEGTSDPGPAALSLSPARTPYSNSSMKMDDVFMETADPEDSPMSPGHSLLSPSSSGSVTPELTSPLLLPTKVESLPPSMPPSPRPEHAKSALRITLPKLSKPSHSASTAKPSRSASNSPITQLNFMSAIEQHNARHKATAAGTKRNGEPASPPTESGTQTGRSKKRKLSRQATSISPNLSPIMTALPSPPASVRTTPPMHPSAMMDISCALEKIDLPPPSIPVKSAATAVTAEEPSSPVSPTTPSKINRAGSTTDDDDVIMESAAESTHTSVVKKKNANAKNKRPWTTEEEKLLLKMVDDQTPIKDIAETLDRSVHSVRSRRQVLTDPGFVKGNGHAQPRRSKPDPSSKLPTYSQMAFLSLARLPDLQGTLNDVASMVEKLFSRYLNRIPRTGHKNLQIWRAQISDALAHEKGHPRPRFESFGIKRGRQWVYRLTVFGKGVMDAMGSVDEICEDLLKNSETMPGGVDGEGTAAGGAGAGLGQGNGYGYSYCPDAFTTKASVRDKDSSDIDLDTVKKEVIEDTSPEALAASAAIANAMAAMAAGMAAMTAAEDEKNAAALSMSILKTGLSGSGASKGHKSSVQEPPVASGSRNRRHRA